MKQLVLSDRQVIADLLREGKNFKQIAEVLKVSSSTILREINRNVGDNGIYDPEQAEIKRRERKRVSTVSPGAVAKLPPEIREEVQKVLDFETPTVQRRPAIVDKYVNDFGPLIEQKFISPLAAMAVLGQEFYMSRDAVYRMLKREGVYQDKAHPICILSRKQ